MGDGGLRNGLAMLVGRQVGYKLTTSDAAGSSAKQIEQFRQAIAAKPAPGSYVLETLTTIRNKRRA